MHKPVKPFSETGLIKDDKDFIRLRTEFERIIIQTMKYQGYLPVHDIRSQWSTLWLGDKYSFKLTVYGSYAGRKKAQLYDFWSDGKLIKGG